MDVRIDKLRGTEDEIKEYTRELEIIRDRIYQVKRQVDTMSLGSYGISDQLEKIIGNTIQTSVIMRKYYMVLNEAAKEYEATENKIIEKYTGIHKNKESDKEKKEEKKVKKKKSFWENAGESIGGFFVGVGKGFGNFAKGVAYDVESFVYDPSDYVDRTKKQVVLGNFTEETTVMGTIIQVGAGVFNVDLPADVRDLSADVMNWEWSKSHIKQTLLDGIGLFPIIGAFKYGDEAADVVKSGSKTADKMDDVKEVGEKVVKGGIDSFSEFSNAAKTIGSRTDITDAQKVKQLQDLFESSGYKADINVPSDLQYIKGFDAKGNVIYDWPDKFGFDESTITSISRNNGLPNTWDRYGYMGGSNFADVPVSGKYSYSERAIPYVKNEAAYHTGTFNSETYFDKIDAIKNSNLDELNNILKSEGVDEVDASYFRNLKNSYDDFIEDTEAVIGSNIDATYGLKGNASAWGDMVGGAGQLVTPLNGTSISRLGIIKERRNHDKKRI